MERSGNIQLQGPYGDIFNICVSAIKSLKGCTIKSAVWEAGIIEARVGFNLRSYGENVKIGITRVGAQLYNIAVTSKPWLPTNVIDLGKNTENVNNVIFVIRQYAANLPRPNVPPNAYPK